MARASGFSKQESRLFLRDCQFGGEVDGYKSGWCTYYYEFADVPEVKFFCGGINEKTPRSSAVWRQGNLLEQTAHEPHGSAELRLTSNEIN